MTWTPPEPPKPPGRPIIYPPVPVVYDDAPGRDALADRLLDRRIVMVSGPLDLARATEASARVMLLDATGDEPIELLLSCPSGELVAASALADTVELVGVELRTICTGSVGGAALLPYAVASSRLAHPHATFRMTEPDLEFSGRAGDIANESAHQASMLNELQARLAVATGRVAAEIAADLQRGRLLTAGEAKEYGLVDEIVHRHGLRSV